MFGGSGTVLFAREPQGVEVYNDINGDLVNLFRVLREETTAEELYASLALTPYARAEYRECFEALRKARGGKRIEWARLTYALYNQAVNGKPRAAGQWSGGKSISAMTKWTRKVDAIPDICVRLHGVIIEELHFRDLIPKYDGPETFFYLDPPYDPATRSEERSYEHDLWPHEHKELVDLLLQIHGSAVLSGYKTPLYDRLISAGWAERHFEVKVTTSATTHEVADYTEVVWCSPNCALTEKVQGDLQPKLI